MAIKEAVWKPHQTRKYSLMDLCGCDRNGYHLPINNMLCFLIEFLIMSVGCNNGIDKNYEIAANILFAEYCKDWGIYDIRRANRFGERVISIACITDSDRIRLDRLIVAPYCKF